MGRNKPFQKLLSCKIPKCGNKPMACDDLEKEAGIIRTTSWVP